MAERQSVTRMLVGHFFRRFFDNDTIQVDGDTQTTVVRAIAVVAVPGLMVSFFLQNHYWQAPLWAAVEIRYFFVLLSFVVMGAVSIFEWEMLFPDRLDFLVLSPLPVKPLQMLVAKAAALIGFMVLFLVGCNCFGTLLLPLFSKRDFWRQVYAHGSAVLLAGVFAALLFLAIGGVLICVLDAARFRVASPLMQMLSVMVLVLFVLQLGLYGDSMHALLTEPLGMARWMPPFWFLGVYERLLHGDNAPAFAKEMARFAVRGTVIAAGVVVVTYPLAWVRMRKMAMEGASRKRGAASRGWAWFVHGIVRKPGERAVFHFIGQTMARNNRYQVYLAMYGGTGLALAVACAVTFHGSLRLSDRGLHAVMPLLLFWVVAGLRTAFAFPLSLAAGWVFRVTGVATSDCAAAARKWVLMCALGVVVFVMAVLRVAGWDVWRLGVQAVVGVCLGVFLTDGFFLFQRSVPFHKPRMPGRTNLPLMLTLYVGVLPVAVMSVIDMELAMEKSLLKLLVLSLVVVALHVGLSVLAKRPDEVEEEMEGYEGEFQLLGLS